MRNAVEALRRRDADALMSLLAPDAAWDAAQGLAEERE
jgi:ketosteroid isomerase-like protein